MFTCKKVCHWSIRLSVILGLCCIQNALAQEPSWTNYTDRPQWQPYAKPQDPEAIRRAWLQRAEAKQNLQKQLDILKFLGAFPPGINPAVGLVPQFSPLNKMSPPLANNRYTPPNWPQLPARSNAPSKDTQKPVDKKTDMVYTFDGKTLSPGEYQGLKIAMDMKNFEQCKWQAADEQMQQAISYFPTLYIAHANRAFALRKQGKVDEALAEAQKAHELAPKRIEPLLMLASIEQTTGDLESAADHYKMALELDPHHPLSDVSKAIGERLKIEIAKENAIEKLVDPNIAHEDYYEYVTYDYITRWAREKFPLKVYVPDEKKCARIPGYRPEFGKAFRDSLEEWHKLSGGLISFTVVQDKDKADIECVWTNNPRAMANLAEAGETRTSFNSEIGILHAKIILLTVAPGMPNISVTDVKRTCLHELGHSLGLTGHSPEPEDIMYFSVSDLQQDLTSRDTKTLCHLYQPQIKLASHYHETGLSNNSNALNDDGLQLLTNKDYEKASAKFSAALRLNPECEPAKRNLAVCLNKLAMENANKGALPAAITEMNVALALGVTGEEGDIEQRAGMLKDLAQVYRKAEKTKEATACDAAAQRLITSTESARPGLQALSESSHPGSSASGSSQGAVTQESLVAPPALAARPVVTKQRSNTQAPAIPASNTKGDTTTATNNSGNQDSTTKEALALSGNHQSASGGKPGSQKDATGTAGTEASSTNAEKSVPVFTSWDYPVLPYVIPGESQSYVLFNPVSAESANAFKLGIEKKEESSPDVDFGPYMADLQRRIKRAWFPPKGNESRRFVVLFKVHRNGTLSDLKVDKSSGVSIADKAGLTAVENASPFKPLPDGAPDDVDIQFTFDYNVFHGGKFTKPDTSMNELIDQWKAEVQKAATASNIAGLGSAYERAGRFPEAKREYLKSKALEPKNAFVLQRLSEIEKRMQESAPPDKPTTQGSKKVPAAKPGSKPTGKPGAPQNRR